MIHAEQSIVGRKRDGGRLAAVLACWAFAFLCAGAAPALAKTYSAERFDSAIRVLPGGALDVTETVVFRFEDGTFDHVYRDIPTRRTDGIEIVSASMDGRTLPFGPGTDQVEVSPGSRVRVRWRFAPRSGSTHTFVLHYVARGVVHRGDRSDVLAWRALPSNHAYAIDVSRVVVEHPDVARAGEPRLSSDRVADADVEPLANGIAVSAASIRRNGWVELRLAFAPGTLAPAPPAWQMRQMRQAELGPRWAVAAVLVLLAGVFALFAVGRGYEAPPKEHASSGPVHDVPDALRPALAGALVSNGNVTIEHAMATLFDLADRRAISIHEEPRGAFGQRPFTLKRLRSAQRLAPFEERFVETVFRHKEADVESISLTKARTRLAGHLRPFAAAIKRELVDRGLLDEDRQQVRDRYGRVSLAMLLIALAGFGGAAALAPRFGPWPFLVPAGLLAAAIGGFIVQSAKTPLSNQGVRLGERWRAYRQHLKDVAHSKVHASREAISGLLAIAVSLGLASAWSKLLKQQQAGVPAWFEALSAADDGGFPAFVAAGSAHHGGGGGGGVGGGAAGGGGSGAG